MRRLIIASLMLYLTLTITACGGGGGGAGPAPTTPPTEAIVKLITTGTLTSGTLIGGIDITIPLPTGVSVKAIADSANSSVLVTNAGVVTVSGVATGTNATAMGTYTSSPTAVTIKVINPDGFGSGEFATVNCDLASGITVAAPDFPTTTLTVFDLDGTVIAGVTAGLMVQLQ